MLRPRTLLLRCHGSFDEPFQSSPKVPPKPKTRKRFVVFSKKNTNRNAKIPRTSGLSKGRGSERASRTLELSCFEKNLRVRLSLRCSVIIPFPIRSSHVGLSGCVCVCGFVSTKAVRPSHSHKYDSQLPVCPRPRRGGGGGGGGGAPVALRSMQHYHEYKKHGGNKFRWTRMNSL